MKVSARRKENMATRNLATSELINPGADRHVKLQIKKMKDLRGKKRGETQEVTRGKTKGRGTRFRRGAREKDAGRNKRSKKPPGGRQLEGKRGGKHQDGIQVIT